MGEEDIEYKCSFCGNTQDQVKRLVAGQRPDVFICNDCVEFCRELLKEELKLPEETKSSDSGNSIMYFQQPGEKNTEKTIELAVKRCSELGIRYVVVATSTGTTAIKVAQEFKNQDVEIIAVTLHAGIWNKYVPPDPEKVRQAEQMGVKFLTCTHSLMGNVGTSIMEKFGGINLTDLIAHTYYTFSQGTKVAVEIVIMAADAGLIPVDQEVTSIAGTDTGADTALVIKPVYCTDFFSLRIREIIAKPR
ncbi:hypothetical protein FJZ33_11225 [Candidatus Poribacteria bacterium]|nr:hypothetical protein [Candidatus Poribacteria bacterium]